MLKIKDNVDLKELEKYCLKYSFGEGWHIYYDNWCGLFIKENRELFIYVESTYDEEEMQKIIEWVNDIIFKLTRDRLIEKVEKC